MMLKPATALAAAALALTTFSGLAFAHSSATGIVKQRMGLMEEIAESMKDRFQEYFRRINAVVDEITEEDLEDDDDRGRNVLTASCLAEHSDASSVLSRDAWRERPPFN